MSVKFLQKSLKHTATAIGMLGLMSAQTFAQDIKVGIISSLSGALAVYGNQTVTGFEMGLEYLTHGSMMIDGRKIVVLKRDTQTKPDIGKQVLTSLFQDENVDLVVGPVSSGVATACLPVAEQFKKILLVEPAVAANITGADWNRYIFRTSRNSYHDGISNALARVKPGTYAMGLAQNYAFGKSGVDAFELGVKQAGGTYLGSELLPFKTNDFSAPYQRIARKFKAYKGDKVLFVIWAGAGDPIGKIKRMNPMEREGIDVFTGGNIMAALKSYLKYEGMEGSTYYYYNIPKNPMNDWLVKEHMQRFNAPPDFFTAGGMAAASAVVTAIRSAKSTDTEKLIATMEDMRFYTPKGVMQFRKEDHQAMQDMYHFKSTNIEGIDHGVPVLQRVIRAEDMQLPIENKR
ncbi:MAG: substrate-binding domain-containing protein [SAR324 cluster bacterium]|nr:substrate-binding domain-containing protein [SAR324 cluster bacterium]